MTDGRLFKDVVDGAEVMERIEIRESVPGDLASIEVLYPDAFPDEDLLPLVRELLQDASGTFSLVGSAVVTDSRF